MFGLSLATRIYVCLDAVDMRKSFDGLYGLVRDHLHQDPLSGHLFLFTNRPRTRGQAAGTRTLPLAGRRRGVRVRDAAAGRAVDAAQRTGSRAGAAAPSVRLRRKARTTTRKRLGRSRAKWLSSITNNVNETTSFEYQAAGNGYSGELTKVTLPYGGALRWAYREFTFAGQRTYREVQYRYLLKGVGETEKTYTFTRDAGDSSLNLHSKMTLDDPGGVGQKVWSFQTTGTLALQGLLTSLDEKDSGTVKARTDYAWTQDADGNPYISATTQTLDPGGSYQKQSRTEQVLDTHGNVTSTTQYDYGTGTTYNTSPARTYTNTYLAGSQYTSRFIFNRLLTSTLTAGGQSTTMITNTYDEGSCPSTELNDPGDQTLHERIAYGHCFFTRGNLTRSVTPSGGTWSRYDAMGNVVSSGDVNSSVGATMSMQNTTNYTVPSVMTPTGYSSLASSFSYNSFLGLIQKTDPNNTSTSASYDGNGRPSSTTSPEGATTNYSYGTNPPTVTALTGSDNYHGIWQRTTKDGLGRAIKVESGDYTMSGFTPTLTTRTVIDTVYEPCACSPLGKVARVSQPYAPGASRYWTVYTYDGLGRTLTVALPGTAETQGSFGTPSGTVSYSYQGNTVTVTDPAGRWKKYTSDAFGNLVQVTEPNPAGGANHETYYTYDSQSRLTQVSMPRDGNQQVRTFEYNAQGRLWRVTHPELGGPVTYTYNSDGTMAAKTDPKGQRLEYNYDSLQRVIGVGAKPDGVNLDLCQSYTYTYGTDGSAGVSNLGRLATITWGQQSSCGLFAESYTYTPSGKAASKTLTYLDSSYNQRTAATSYQYDILGRVTSQTYPASGRVDLINGITEAGDTYQWTFDSMGRPYSMVWINPDPNGYPTQTIVSSAQYGSGGELTSLTYAGLTETRSYNSRGQLTRQTIPGVVDLEYRFSTTNNDGKITQSKNWISGEEVTYQYDVLQRLTSAVTTGPEWGLSFSYDGFGNKLGQTVTKGSGPANSLTISPLTNRLAGTGYSYDLNGNLTNQPGGPSLSYDVFNRVAVAGRVYDAQNHRVMENGSYGTIIFYGAYGERLAKLTGLTAPSRTAEMYLYFGGRMIQSVLYPAGTGPVLPAKVTTTLVQDRLGSVVASKTGTNAWQTMSYYPYGEERTSTANDRDKFATYWRDPNGLDYAWNRYYQSGHGRFLSVDPVFSRTAKLDPQSWNRYGYGTNDPVNRMDPTGAVTVESCYSAFSSACEALGLVFAAGAVRRKEDVYNYKTSVPARGGFYVQYIPPPPSSLPQPIVGVMMDAPDMPEPEYGNSEETPGVGGLDCTATLATSPVGRVSSAQTAFGAVTALGYGVDVFVDYKSGDIGLYISGSIGAGWNGISSVSATTGLMFENNADVKQGDKFAGTFYFAAASASMFTASAMVSSLDKNAALKLISLGASASLLGQFALTVGVSSSKRLFTVGNLGQPSWGVGAALATGLVNGSDFAAYDLRKMCH